MGSGILSRVLTGTSISGVVAPITANSDWENAIGEITTQTEKGDTKAYYTTIQGINSLAQIGQTWQPTQVNQSFMIGQIEASVWNVFAPYSINDMDLRRLDKVLAKSNAGGSSLEFLKALAKQGVAQKLRLMALWGMEAGEGIINGATQVNIGTDPSSNESIVTVDTFWLTRKLVLAINKVINATKNTASDISLLTSLEIYNYLHNTTIKSTDYIATGSAVSIADYLKQICTSSGRSLDIGFDTTLSKSDTTSTKDAIFINARGLRLKDESDRKKVGEYRMNGFALNANSVNFNTTIDVGEKIEEVNPKFNQIISGSYEVTATCGVTLRADTACVIYYKYQ